MQQAMWDRSIADQHEWARESGETAPFGIDDIFGSGWTNSYVERGEMTDGQLARFSAIYPELATEGANPPAPDSPTPDPAGDSTQE